MVKITSYLGVDVGASGMKIAELANDKGRARLLTYGFSEREQAAETPNAESAGHELMELCKEAGVKTKKAITGLPMASVFSTLFTFEAAQEKQLESLIKSKMQKISPIPEDDLVLDWKKLSQESKEAPIRVLVTAASKKQINNYVGIFKIAGLELSSLETEAFAMIRSLLGKDLGAAIIVDVGAVKTNVLIVKDSAPLIHKTIKLGGADINEKLAQKMGVDKGLAEKLKKSIGAEGSPEMDFILDAVSESIEDEIKYCKEFYSSQYNGSSVEKLVLTGGSAGIAGFASVLSKKTGLRVFLGDPWTRVIYPDDLRPALDKIGPNFGTAVGLAMREILK